MANIDICVEYVAEFVYTLDTIVLFLFFIYFQLCSCNGIICLENKRKISPLMLQYP